jgi:hypothetical protein
VLHEASQPLAPMDTDRETTILGKLPPSHPSAGKRLCARWLDELIVALWHDLQAYMEWKLRDQELVLSKGQSHAGLLLGLPVHEDAEILPESSLSPRSPTSLNSLPSLTANDWMRRGALAERLYHDGEALLAYRCCVRSGFNLTAWLAIMRLASQASDIQLALSAVQTVLSWHGQKLRLNSPDVPQPIRSNTPPRVPLALLCSVHLLAMHTGSVAAVKQIVSGSQELNRSASGGGADGASYLGFEALLRNA